MKKRLAIQLVLGCVFFLGCSKPQIRPLSSESTLLAFGDSLTFGYGVERKESYPSILEGLLGCEVINSGVNGEDVAGGLRRLPQNLAKYEPDLVILCLGGNDMLRRRPLKQVKSNLRKMIELVQEAGADVVLVGVPKPGLILVVPDLYEELADEFSVPYEREILVEVLSNRSLKNDQIHPNTKGYRMIADKLYALIKASEQ